jgi:hypothetical protein
MAGPVETTSEKVVPNGTYSASRIRLYGIPFLSSRCLVGTADQRIDVGCVPSPIFEDWKAALIYGYSYQGHVYSLPEPVIMLVDEKTVRQANEAGYAGSYRMWDADKLDRTAQMLLTNDTFEELLLKKNIGESRQPVAYHAMMAMSHRGGKLMD